ncbi:MAG: hypothetical protein ABNH38_12015 [Tateyamaria sp.]|jgi:hypothetical protein
MRENELLRLATVIPHVYLRDEAALIGLKWPAYRFHSPMQLNLMFRDAYNDTCHSRRPYNSGEEGWVPIGGISPTLNFSKVSGQLTQLHVARQQADLLGMPYEDYIRFCFDFAERRVRKFIPRPNQLAPSPAARETWFAKLKTYWPDEVIWTRLLSTAGLESYDLRNDLGLPAQSRFRQQVLRLAQRQVTNNATFYGLAVLERRWLRPEDVVAVNPPVWEQARLSAETDDRGGGHIAAPHVPLTDMGQRQGCFGLPGVDASTDESCRACSARQACDMLRDDIIVRLREQHGCDDPVGEAKRLANRVRVRRHRAKNKDAAAPLLKVIPSPEPGA